MPPPKQAALVSNGLKTRIVGHDRVPAEELLENPWNHRRHSRAQQRVVTASLDELGIVKSILVNKLTGRIIDGHDRLRDAKKRGPGTLVDVEYVELNDAEERKALIILDAAVGLATVDAESLDALLEESTASSGVLQNWFDDMEEAIASKLKKPDKSDLDAAPKVDQAASLRSTWGVEPGSVWELGDHRLICGDSTKAEVVARLFGGAVPGIMVTDPPYGVKYDPKWRHDAGVNKSDRKGKVQNDDRASWSAALMHFPGAVAYVWHAGKFGGEVERSLQACGFEIRSQIIWVKPRFAMSRGQYHWRHEPCYFAVKKGEQAGWAGDRKQQTVWADVVDSWAGSDPLFAGRVDETTVLAFGAEMTTVWEIGYGGEDEKATVHGTQKPVECMARPIRNHAAGLVFDPFCGTGSTIIACERLDRQCFAIEIDPEYCAVILQRYQDATGTNPVQLS